MRFRNVLVTTATTMLSRLVPAGPAAVLTRSPDAAGMAATGIDTAATTVDHASTPVTSDHESSPDPPPPRRRKAVGGRHRAS